MKHLARIRLVAALVLASALTMPAYTCSGYAAPDGTLVSSIPSGADSAAYRPAQVPHRPLDGFELRSLDSWTTLLAFIWPFPLLLLRARAKGRVLVRIVRWSAPPLALLSSGVIWWNANTGNVAYGTFVAVGANVILLAIAIGDLVLTHRSAARRPTGGSP